MSENPGLANYESTTSLTAEDKKRRAPRTPPRFALGDRVRFTHNVVKERVHHGVTWKVVGVPVRFVDYMDENKRWQREDRPLTEGVIVGVRTLSDYTIEYESNDSMWGSDGYTVVECVPGTGRKAWLVSYDLRRKPVLVLDEHVTAVEDD